jgi:hypothetical protein
MAEKDTDKKLNELDEKYDAESIRKYYKARLIRRINKGEIGLIDELEKLKKLEAGEIPSSQAKPSTEPKDNDEDTDEVGVPERLRFRRSYTLTEAALEARKKNAKKSTGPKTEKGKKACAKNAWKHGMFAQGFILNKIKPCKSTCPHYPCDLVKDNAVSPGGECLDKAAVIQFFAAIGEAVKNKQYDEFNELAAFTIANQLNILHTLMEDIQRDGTMLKKEKHDKEGKYLGYEVVPHPSLLSLIKLSDSLGITVNEMMITPKAITKQEDNEEGMKTIADLMSSIGRGVNKGKGKDKG